MLSGCRAARNQLLKDVMRDYGYLEHMGMGIPRKIVKSMQAHNGTLPELIEDEERFIVRLFDDKIKVGLWKRFFYQRIMPPFFFIVPEPMLFHHLFQ